MFRVWIPSSLRCPAAKSRVVLQSKGVWDRFGPSRPRTQWVPSALTPHGCHQHAIWGSGSCMAAWRWAQGWVCAAQPCIPGALPLLLLCFCCHSAGGSRAGTLGDLFPRADQICCRNGGSIRTSSQSFWFSSCS